MKTILFVDDEVRILQGLKRLLRSMRDQWSMHFMSSGPEALDYLRRNAVDVIVTDMRMPGMTGDTILKQVKDEYPHVVRLVLSGHSEKESAEHSPDIAHQFLTKPCDSAELRDAVNRLLAYNKSLTGVANSPFAESLGVLPSRSLLIRQLNEACLQGGIASDEVVASVEKDVEYSAQLLELANSPYFGLRRQLRSIGDAARQLGVDMLRNLVISEQLRSSLAAEGASEELLDEIQRHGFLASRLAARMLRDHEQRKTARSAALVHDIGKNLLACRVPRQYAQVQEKQAQGLGLIEAEREILEVTHPEIGAYLLGTWGLPAPIVETVLYHHEPSRAGLKRFGAAGAVHVASVLTHEEEHLLDRDYLRAVGVEGELEDWQMIHADELKNTRQRISLHSPGE